MQKSSEEVIAEAFQAIEDDRGGGLVGNFVGIAEVANPAEPDSVGYQYVVHGSPAALLGLHAYLGVLLKQDVADGMEDG
ncbi:MAG TPA: hypothetical protein VKZ82_12950 [Nonomuraea sp.]|jgi:hypothetical protein|nr:hypothetical protein [Nonomuraea sp.]